jgi:hypothetical protein
MGTIKKGILGAFSGKVGNVVGASWKGIAYMRSLPASVKNPRSLGQRMQRSKFSIALQLIQPITALVRLGWKLYANSQSAFNAAMSYAVFNAITGDYPDYETDFSKLLISRGNMAGALNAAAVEETGVIKITWDDNSGNGFAEATDIALIAVLNPVKGEAISITNGATRSAGAHDVTCPNDWDDDKVHVYLGFISENGKEVANSVYLGDFTVS